MFSQKIYRARDRIQPNCELTPDGNFEPGISSCSLQFFGSQQQSCTPGLLSESPSQDSMGLAKPSSTTMLSHFEPPASAFYAAERFMRFPLYGSLRVACDPGFPLHQSSCGSFQIRSGDPPAVDHGALSWRQTSIPKENQDSKVIKCSIPLVCEPSRFSLVLFFPEESASLFQVSCDLYSKPKSGMSFTFQKEKQPRRLSSTGSGLALPSKTRIRWTQDLHEKFVECVNRLGGAKSKHRLI